MIQVIGLHKTLGVEKVLCGIDLIVPEGGTLVVLGRSGSGKSVLLKHLVGLFQPDAGRVLVNGEDISGLKERQLGPIRKKVGILFQSGALFDSMSVGENLAFPLRESGMFDPELIRERVAEALGMVDLAGEEGKMPE
ncbi:MAG: ATP-binding cassette domain-containing protein, partial [Verrucomicrobiota bacterium]